MLKLVRTRAQINRSMVDRVARTYRAEKMKKKSVRKRRRRRRRGQKNGTTGRYRSQRTRCRHALRKLYLVRALVLCATKKPA